LPIDDKMGVQVLPDGSIIKWIKTEFNQLTKASEKVPFSIRKGDRNEIRNH
jgi:hypothetical protein